MKKLAKSTYKRACVLIFALMLAQPLHAHDPALPDQPDVGQVEDAAEALPDIMEDIDALFTDAPPEEAPPQPATLDAAPTPEGTVEADRMTAPEAAVATPDGIRGPIAPSPVVVELFTSQGCAACPPADEMLADLAQRPDVLALAWHVDYWDYLGWVDEFAKPAFTARQKDYGRANESGPGLFTPQMIVNGRPMGTELQPAMLEDTIESERARTDIIGLTVTASGPRREVRLTPRPTASEAPANAAVALIRYLPARKVSVLTGENRGRTLTQHNIVAHHEVLAIWTENTPLQLTVTLGAGARGGFPEDTRHALIVQRLRNGLPGPIEAALALD